MTHEELLELLPTATRTIIVGGPRSRDRVE